MGLGYIVGVGAGKNRPAFSYRIPAALLTALSPSAGAVCFGDFFALKKRIWDVTASGDTKILPMASKLLAEMDADFDRVTRSPRKYPVDPVKWPVCLNPLEIEHDVNVPAAKKAAFARAIRIDYKNHEELHAYARFLDQAFEERIQRETGVKINMETMGVRKHVDEAVLNILASVGTAMAADMKQTGSLLHSKNPFAQQSPRAARLYLYRFAIARVGTWGQPTTIAEELLARIEGFRYVESDLYREGKGSPFEKQRFREYVLDNLAAMYGGLAFDWLYVGLKQRAKTPRDVLVMAYDEAAKAVRKTVRRVCSTRSRKPIQLGETLKMNAPGIGVDTVVVRDLFLTYATDTGWMDPRTGRSRFGTAACSALVRGSGGYEFEVGVKNLDKP
jgi:hypothetical protein